MLLWFSRLIAPTLSIVVGNAAPAIQYHCCWCTVFTTNASFAFTSVDWTRTPCCGLHVYPPVVNAVLLFGLPAVICLDCLWVQCEIHASLETCRHLKFIAFSCPIQYAPHSYDISQAAKQWTCFIRTTDTKPVGLFPYPGWRPCLLLLCVGLQYISSFSETSLCGAYELEWCGN